METWIKLYRKSLNSAVFQNSNLWKVWCWCLMKANHNDSYKILFEGKELKLKPGQFITGRNAGAEECNMSPSTFWRNLKKLEEMGNVDSTSDNKKSLITIVKYSHYQGEEIKVGSTSDNKRTSSGHKQEYKNKRINKATNIFSIENIPLNLNGELFYKNNFFYITQELKNELLEKFRNKNITEELLTTEFYKMESWLETNEKKKNYKLFIINWLGKIKTQPIQQNEFNLSFNPIGKLNGQKN